MQQETPSPYDDSDTTERLDDDIMPWLEGRSAPPLRGGADSPEEERPGSSRGSDTFASNDDSAELPSNTGATNDGRDVAANDDAGDAERPFNHHDRTYHGALPTSDLIMEVRRLLGVERRAQRLICRYLADLADRVQRRNDADLNGYADEFHAARTFFGLNTRETRERVRIGRALRQLPRIERALVSGDLSYSRVREVTRVATPESELDWLWWARRLDMRTLERQVAAAHGSPFLEALIERDGEPHPGRPARGAPSGAARPPRAADSEVPGRTVRISFELSADNWALLERALDGVRRANDTPMTDAEALTALARHALTSQRPAKPVTSPAHCSAEPAQRTAPPPSPVAHDPRINKPIAPHLGSRNAAGRGVDPQPFSRSGNSAMHAPATNGERPPQLGTQRRDPHRSSPTHLGSLWDLDESAERVLRVMGRRGRWSIDALIAASGLSVSQVSSALTCLELQGWVRLSPFGFEPT